MTLNPWQVPGKFQVPLKKEATSQKSSNWDHSSRALIQPCSSIHPTIHTFLISFWGWLLLESHSRRSRDFAFKRLREETSEGTWWLFISNVTIRWFHKMCFFQSVVSFLCKVKENWVKKRTNNEKQQNVHIRNEIMIQNEAQNREPYNNEITLCISYFSSLYPSETVAETTRQSDSPSIVLKTSLACFPMVLRIRLIPRVFFFVPDLACHMPSPWTKTDEKRFNVRGCFGSKTRLRASPLTSNTVLWQFWFMSANLSYQKLAPIIILCKKMKNELQV